VVRRGGDQEVLDGLECRAAAAQPGLLDAVLALDAGTFSLRHLVPTAAIWARWPAATARSDRDAFAARVGSSA